jgi:hypothetical protein
MGARPGSKLHFPDDYLHDTHMATQRWYLGQFRNDKHIGQSNIGIAGQGTVNNMAEEH